MKPGTNGTHDVLTKENFWNEIAILYPDQFEQFSKWIDGYKARVNWDGLFNIEEGPDEKKYNDRKYHDLPVEMQVGIFIAYVREVGGGYLLYSSRSLNIREDIRNYFELRSKIQ